MGQDLNNCLGVPHKAGISYFRDWTVGAVGGGNTFIYGPGDPASSKIVGSGLSVRCTDSTNGFQLLVNEAGLYHVKLGIRIGTGSALFYVVRYNPAFGATAGNYISSSDTVAAITAGSTATRYECSGIIDMQPGQFFMILTNAANSVNEFYFSATKLATNSL